jgi:ABC-2 type transport system permease protein
MMDIFYWPVVELILWGFITFFLKQVGGNIAGIAAFLLGGLILWQIVRRAQQDVSVSFLEDIWSRNFINLFVSPLRWSEYLMASMIVGGVKIVFTLVVMFVLALFLYAFNIFTLGFALIPFAISLTIFGWIVGIAITAPILRYGTDIQVLAFSLGIFLQPFSAVFYPLSTLPPLVQKFSLLLPATHIFEGMRQVLLGGPFPLNYLVASFALNILFFIAAMWYFKKMFDKVRELGMIAKLE